MDDKNKECLITDIQKLVHDQLKQIKDMGITNTNVDSLYKLIDIEKDIENIKYWKAKIEGDEYENEIRNIPRWQKLWKTKL